MSHRDVIDQINIFNFLNIIVTTFCVTFSKVQYVSDGNLGV